MRQIIIILTNEKIITLIAILIASLLTVEATNYKAYTVNLFKTYNDNPENIGIATGTGRRTPPMPIPCTVSEAEGITVAIGEADILAYEIWDAEGAACEASYVEGTDAAVHLLSTPGEYQLRIVTSEYSYIGYITTL